MKTKHLFLSCLSLLLTAGLLAGCQSRKGDSFEEGDVRHGSAAPADWSVGFRTGPQQEGDRLYVAGFLELKHRESKEPDGFFISCLRSEGDELYALYRCDMQQDQKVFLEKHSLDKSEPEQIMELDPADWSLPHTSIEGYDLTEDGYVFLVRKPSVREEDGQMAPGALYTVFTDSQGMLISQRELTDILADQGVTERTDADGAALYRDGEGYLYLIMDQGSLLLVMDGEGKPVARYDCGIDRRGKIDGPVRDNSGRLIFPVSRSDDRTTRFFGRAEQGMKELAIYEELIRGYWLGMYGSCMYYEDIASSALIRWDVGTGIREKVMDMEALGMPESSQLCLVLKEGNDVRLRSVYGGKLSAPEDFLVTLSEQPPEQGNPVRVAILMDPKYYDGKFLQGAIARFNRSHPQYAVTMETGGEDIETYRTRVMADIMSGKGPDILCVSVEDMESLAKSEALMPVDGLVSEETLKILLPGVLQFCTYNGETVGVMPMMSLRIMTTSKSIWSGDGWTLEDFLALAEEKEGLEGLVTSDTVTLSDAYGSLYQLVGLSIKQSRFLDMEAKESRFEKENFMRVLEVVKRYAHERDSSHQGWNTSVGIYDLEGYRSIREETYLALTYGISDPLTFAMQRNGMGYEVNMAGYPSESGGTNYIVPHNGFLVVNVGAGNQEAVSDFLEYILSFDNQSRLNGEGLSVRSDMADRLIEFDEENGYKWVARPNTAIRLNTWEDPTEEYNALLQSCEPYDYDNKIFDIIWEEAQAYFSGDKDALAVTQAIDNRVQLYLDERN